MIKDARNTAIYLLIAAIVLSCVPSESNTSAKGIFNFSVEFSDFKNDTLYLLNREFYFARGDTFQVKPNRIIIDNFGKGSTKISLLEPGIYYLLNRELGIFTNIYCQPGGNLHIKYELLGEDYHYEASGETAKHFDYLERRRLKFYTTGKTRINYIEYLDTRDENNYVKWADSLLLEEKLLLSNRDFDFRSNKEFEELMDLEFELDKCYRIAYQIYLRRKGSFIGQDSTYIPGDILLDYLIKAAENESFNKIPLEFNKYIQLMTKLRLNLKNNKDEYAINSALNENIFIFENTISSLAFHSLIDWNDRFWELCDHPKYYERYDSLLNYFTKYPKQASRFSYFKKRLSDLEIHKPGTIVSYAVIRDEKGLPINHSVFISTNSIITFISPSDNNLEQISETLRKIIRITDGSSIRVYTIAVYNEEAFNQIETVFKRNQLPKPDAYINLDKNDFFGNLLIYDTPRMSLIKKGGQLLRNDLFIGHSEIETIDLLKNIVKNPSKIDDLF